MSGTSAPIVTRRRLVAPRESVFEAFRDPAKLVAWWGPHGSVNTFREFDLRPGGRWRFTMQAADGSRYEMDHRFVEVDPPSRVVFRHEQEGHGFTMAIALDEDGGGTLVTWRMTFDDPDEAERVRAFVERANHENLERLSRLLAET